MGYPIMQLPEPEVAITALTQREFDDLYEYSISLPTDPRVGFRWKRRSPAYARPSDPPPDWWLGTVVPCRCTPRSSTHNDILWTKIVIFDPPSP